LEVAGRWGHAAGECADAGYFAPVLGRY
jgi:hypothetical protein